MLWITLKQATMQAGESYGQSYPVVSISRAVNGLTGSDDLTRPQPSLSFLLTSVDERDAGRRLGTSQLLDTIITDYARDYDCLSRSH